MADEKEVVDDFDVETVSLEELKKLANEEAATAAAAGDGSGESGESAKASKSSSQAAANDNKEEQSGDGSGDDSGEGDEQVIYEKVIDLGDGSGVQIFRADSMEELVDQLVKAQENATKKIREQEARLRAAEKPAESKTKQLSAEEEFVLSQELMTKPSEAFRKLFKETTGFEISEFKSKIDRLNAFERGQVETQNANSFVATHPDYVKNEANGKRMVAYLQTYRLEATPENLEQAFQSLKQSGLLELRDASKAGAENENESEQTPDTSRIAKPEGNQAAVAVSPQQRKKAASGLSARGRSTPPPSRTAGPTEDELYNMPLEKLRELANKDATSRSDDF